MSECRMQIATGLGNRIVDGARSPSGELLLHRAIGTLCGQWAVTHARTGRLVANFSTSLAAVRCAETIDGIDWEQWERYESEILTAVDRWGGMAAD